MKNDTQTHINILKKGGDKGESSGQHTSRAALDGDADVKRTALKHIEKLINELHEFVQPRPNVHKEIKAKVTSIGNAFTRLLKLEDEPRPKKQSSPSPKPKEGHTPLKRLTQSIAGNTTEIDTGAEADSDSVTDEKRDPKRSKRKQRSSPESGDKHPKRLKEVGPTQPPKEKAQHSGKETSGWQQVLSKKDKKKLRIEQSQKQPKQTKQRKQRKPRRPATRSNALIVRPKEKEMYAEILCRVKKDVPEDQVRSTVDKIRKTATGDLLIILNKDSTDGGQVLHKTIADILKDDAKVISKGPQQDLEIRDLDDTTTKEEVLAALQKAAGEEGQISMDAIRSVRKTYGGTQIAILTLAVPIAEKILGEQGKIRIGWVNCRIRTVERPTKCFKCWHYGHLATRCKSKVDRSNLCINCGEDGHKARDCKKEARCAVCTEKGNTENCAHVAGTSRCPVYREALQKKKTKDKRT